ncbi:MAG: response regulator [Oscillospiraceae bacterium]
MTTKEKILIVEDEQTIRNFMQAILSAKGYDVLLARSGAMADTMIASHCPDLIILDLGLPDTDGMNVLSRVREWSKIPVIVVSARSHERDKVVALDAGADDYLTKPFGTEELLARIRAAIRHTRTPASSDALANTGLFRAGELTIDYGKRRVFIAGRDAGLTQNEYKLVALLGLHAGKVLTYDYLIRELWGPSARSDNQILRVNMANIRRKIEKNPAQPAYIFTEVGVGYRMIEGD